MSGPLFHVGAVATCPHGGQISTISSNARVLVTGMPAALLTDQFVVAGCVFATPATGPQPCVLVQWMTPTVESLITGQPAITAASVGLCIAGNGVPNGPAIVASTQLRVVAT